MDFAKMEKQIFYLHDIAKKDSIDSEIPVMFHG